MDAKKTPVSCSARSILVVCGFLLRDGAVLIARRAPGQRAQGLWEFPGGKVERGEALGAALEREWMEELGLAVLAGPVVAEAVVGPIRLVALRLTCPEWRDPRLVVHDRWCWCPVARLGGLAFPSPDLPLIAWLERHGRGCI